RRCRARIPATQLFAVWLLASNRGANLVRFGTMRRDIYEVPAPSLGGVGTVVAYGHWGTPVLIFPAEGGSAFDMEHNGIIDALAEPLANGHLKVYTVQSHDQHTWSDKSLPIEERARRHEGYHAWICEQVA